jgi:hypothetical protein
MVGDLGFVHVEGQGLLEPEAHHAFGFIPFGGQRLEVEQHHPHGGIRQNRDDVMRPSTDAAQGVANGFVHRVGLPQIGLDQVGNHAAGSQFGGSAGFQGATAILGNPAHQYPVSGNFASQLRPGSGLWKSAHLWGLSQS